MSKKFTPQQSCLSVSSDDEKEEDQQPPQLTRKRDVMLNFVMVILPMLAIPLIFLAFVFYTREHPVFYESTLTELPTPVMNFSGKYTTRIPVGAFLLVGSWASTAGQFIMAPFMLLFSFIIAKTIHNLDNEATLAEVRQVMEDNCQQVHDMTDAVADDLKQEETDELIKGISKAVSQDIWSGLKLFVFRGKRTVSQAARVAIIGGVLSAIFTILLIAGDNLLHLSVKSIQATVYDKDVTPDGSHLYDDYSFTSFTPSEECQDLLQSPVDTAGPNTSPCSLDETDNLLNVARATYAYSVLDLGISQQTGSFFVNDVEYFRYLEAVDKGSASDIQVVTYEDPQTSLTHALLLNMTAATVFSSFANGTSNSSEDVQFFGTDFAASTVSMVTECVPATQACGMRNATYDNETASNDLSIPFDCSTIFSGNIWQPPTDGLQRFEGWHSIFFDNSTGVALNTSKSSQLNPFYFNATAALTSVDFSTLERVSDPQVPSGAVVDAGHGRVALALSCKATIYNVNYSLLNYEIDYFHAVPANPQLASIVKAPLQVGLGRYELYIQAQIGIMLNQGLTVADYMGISFSQIGLALSSGAFDVTRSYAQRVRYLGTVTVVSGYALWFIVVTCFLCAAAGMAFGFVALLVQRNHRYAMYQAQIVPVTRFSITDSIKQMAADTFQKVKDLVSSLQPDSSEK